MQNLKCKKTTILAGVLYYTEGERYCVNKEDDDFYHDFDEKGNVNFISKKLSHIHLNFDDIFYTSHELRKWKIQSILKEED
jgi:hypothetical protein